MRFGIRVHKLVRLSAHLYHNLILQTFTYQVLNAAVVLILNGILRRTDVPVTMAFSILLITMLAKEKQASKLQIVLWLSEFLQEQVC